MEDFDLNMVPSNPRAKLSKDFKLNRETAKELYFALSCDFLMVKNPVIEWYKSEFTQEDFYEWHNEYVAKEIQEINHLIDEFLKKEPNLEDLIKLDRRFCFLYEPVITDNRVIFDAIELLKRFSKEIGDFFYGLLQYAGPRDNGPSCLDMYMLIRFACKSNDYQGFVCNLYKKDKKELLNKLLDEYIIPLLIEMPKESETMMKLGLKYDRGRDGWNHLTQNESYLKKYQEYFKDTEFEDKFNIEVKITY